MKNVKVRGKHEIPREKEEFRGKKANSAANSAARLVKTQIPRLGSKFRGPRKTVGHTYYQHGPSMLGTTLRVICYMKGAKIQF